MKSNIEEKILCGVIALYKYEYIYTYIYLQETYLCTHTHILYPYYQIEIIMFYDFYLV